MTGSRNSELAGNEGGGMRQKEEKGEKAEETQGGERRMEGKTLKIGGWQSLRQEGGTEKRDGVERRQ